MFDGSPTERLRSDLGGRPLALRTAAKMSDQKFDEFVAAQLDKDMEAERREARRPARSKCRARALIEAAEAALAALPADEAAAERDPTSALGKLGHVPVVLRPMSALELGLLYVWMRADEAADVVPVTRWWSGGAVGIQQSWEAASGWYDEELDKPRRRGDWPAVASIERMADAVADSGMPAVDRHTGQSAVSREQSRASSADADAATPPPPPPPHVLGAFLPGLRTPLAFAATKTPARRDAPATAWIIDAMGSRVAARGRGLGSELARHCIDRAKDTGASEYRIDVVPSAVGFWAKLGFVEEEPDAEQEFYMDKGGDRPMSLRL